MDDGKAGAGQNTAFCLDVTLSIPSTNEIKAFSARPKDRGDFYSTWRQAQI